MLPNLWPFTGRQGDCWPGRKKTNLLGPISRSPNGDNKKSKWKKDKLSENEFQLIKVKGTARNGGFNSIQPGASDSVQNGFAPPLEVIGGTDGCYMKQFQLDQFLDHLTVIIKSGCVLDSTSGGGGGPHNVPSTLYRGECKLCEAQGVTGEYWGESGFSGFHRCERHRAEVSSRKDSNAFAKHLALCHPNAGWHWELQDPGGVCFQETFDQAENRSCKNPIIHSNIFDELQSWT